MSQKFVTVLIKVTLLPIETNLKNVETLNNFRTCHKFPWLMKKRNGIIISHVKRISEYNVNSRPLQSKFCFQFGISKELEAANLVFLISRWLVPTVPGVYYLKMGND